MKQMALDAMILADRQHGSCLRESMAYFRDDNKSELGAYWLKVAIRRGKQFNKFQAYVVGKMKE
jgi:hypothetical protein